MSKRLPFTKKPYPNELMSSWLGRIAAIYHTTWQGISAANGYPYIGDYDLKDDTIEFLSALTSIDSDEIRQIDPARRFPFTPVTRFLCHPVTGRADPDFCTECFRDDLYFGRDNYLRLEWALAGVSIAISCGNTGRRPGSAPK